MRACSAAASGSRMSCSRSLECSGTSLARCAARRITSLLASLHMAGIVRHLPEGSRSEEEQRVMGRAASDTANANPEALTTGHLWQPGWQLGRQCSTHHRMFSRCTSAMLYMSSSLTST